MKLASTISIAAAWLYWRARQAVAQTSAPAVYIHAGALLDRPGQAPRGASTIIVREGRVEAVRDGLVAPEGGARLVDLSKQFVLPGLIDMHVHIFNDDDKMRARLEQNNRDIEDNLLIGVGNARRTLEAGFTTVRDLGSEVRSVTALRDAILSGAIAGPDDRRGRTRHLDHRRSRRRLEQHQSRHHADRARALDQQLQRR